MSSLRDFLDKLENQDFEALEGRGEVYMIYDELMSILSDALGMDEDFMHTLPHMPEGLKPAGIAQINENKTPWAVFNIVPFDDPGRWRDESIGKMDQYLYYSGAELGVTLSTEYVIVHDSDFEMIHDVDAVDESGIRRVELELEPPEMYKQQEGSEGPDGRRAQNYVVAEHYEVDLKKLEDTIEAMDNAETDQERGDAFEEFAGLLMEAIPFLRVRQRKLRTRTSELDLLVEYTGADKKTIFDKVSDDFLIECKNWSKSVGSDAVGKFVRKLNKLDVDFGIMFARNGITGDKNSDGLGEIRDAFFDSSKIILVVDNQVIDRLLNGESFYQILDELYYDRRFDRK
jgi:hypothetical protein